MGKLPSGTVTFLFTDIEGSTKLAQQYPAQWESLRARHHAILQSAMETHNGYVFQIIGDAFCVAFHTAGDALKAATKAQQDLQTETWGDGTVRVRMGIHTGEAEVQTDGQYHGYLALSLVQRIMSAGHGGQILVSGATENLLRGGFPDNIDLYDLGRHNFKDVLQPVRIFQINSSGLQRDFPPLRTFDVHPNNLPTQLTSFIGREKELADVKRLLSDTHMLTLIGPGGTGKTRLSIRAARDVLNDYPDGVWLIDLAPVLDPLLVPRTTAITIGLRDEPQRPVIDMLCDYLSTKKMLIILDNCEHLVDACAKMAEQILKTAMDVRILASSREALGVAGEVTYNIPSLGLPDVNNLPSVESLSQFEAVKLFIDRAASAVPSFKVTNDTAPFLAQICHRLDGIPLAIELAAAKVRVLSLEQIAKRLDDRFRLLTGGRRTALERHQTLRAAVDWSYNLLSPEEQTLFRRLSVFVGGWTLEAAEVVCGDESGPSVVRSDEVLGLMEHLINKSIVVAEEAKHEIRYRMLETIRQYANEKLVDSGESDALHDKHLDCFLNLAETAAPHLIRSEQLEWLAQLDANYENLRAALEWALNKETAEPSLRLCAALGRFWLIRCYWLEGSKWLKSALAKPILNATQTEKTARVRALYQDADLADQVDDLDRIKSSAELSFALAQEVGDKRDIAIARYYVGSARNRIEKFDEALKLIESSLGEFSQMKDLYWQAFAQHQINAILARQHKIKVEDRISLDLESAQQAGERLYLVDVLTDFIGYMFRLSRFDEARRYAEEADALLKELGSTMSQSPRLYGSIALLNGNYQEARNYFEEMERRYGILGEQNIRSGVIASLGTVAEEEGNLNQAQAYYEEALSIAQEVNRKSFVLARTMELARIAYLKADKTSFKGLVTKGITLARGTQPRMFMVLLLWASIPYSQRQDVLARLLGVIKTYEREHESVFGPRGKQQYDRAEAHARQALGDAVFESAFAGGRKITLGEALDLALKTTEEL